MSLELWRVHRRRVSDTVFAFVLKLEVGPFWITPLYRRRVDSPHFERAKQLFNCLLGSTDRHCR